MPRSPKKDFPAEWTGQHSGVSTASQFVAKTQAEWKTLWSAAHSTSTPSPKAPVLPKGKMAIGIFTGTDSQPSDISISKIEETGGQTVVNWKAECSSSMLAVMNDPFLLKWVDKTESPVVFQQEALSRKASTPGTPIADLNGKKFGI
jgi:hypothetical protein